MGGFLRACGSLFVCLLLNQSQSSSCARRKDSLAKINVRILDAFFAEKERKEVAQLAEEEKNLFFSLAAKVSMVFKKIYMYVDCFLPVLVLL